MSLRITRSELLITIPSRKIIKSLEQTLKECEVCSSNKSKLDSACEKCRFINTAKQRYANSNIPVGYWNLDMNRDFKGDESLLKRYNEIISNLNEVYNDGISICFAGYHGVGKTMVCTNILKRAAEKGYNCLYVTLSDIVELVTAQTGPEKITARKELLMVDFLVIDEFDPRHMSSINSSDLFGRTLENIFRTRAQNNLPTLMCTNSPNVIDSFSGQIKESIGSLMSYVEIFPVIGKDFRKTRGLDARTTG